MIRRDFTSVVVKPGEWLILVPRQRLEHAALLDIADRIPADLRDRVLVACDVDAYVVSERCDPANDVHVEPHVGCILR